MFPSHDQYKFVYETEDIRLRLERAKAIVSDLYELYSNNLTNNQGAISYSLNDGQTSINTTFESLRNLDASIRFWEGQVERIEREMTGSTVYLRSGIR